MLFQKGLWKLVTGVKLVQQSVRTDTKCAICGLKINENQPAKFVNNQKECDTI